MTQLQKKITKNEKMKKKQYTKEVFFTTSQNKGNGNICVF
jgi:hypothetical protein